MLCYRCLGHWLPVLTALPLALRGVTGRGGLGGRVEIGARAATGAATTRPATAAPRAIQATALDRRATEVGR